MSLTKAMQQSRFSSAEKLVKALITGTATQLISLGTLDILTGARLESASEAQSFG